MSENENKPAPAPEAETPEKEEPEKPAKKKKMPHANIFADIFKTVAGRVISAVLIIAIVFFGARYLLSANKTSSKITAADVTASIMMTDEKDVAKLYTSSYVYNGIADKYKDDDTSKEQYHIAYKATIKVGVDVSMIMVSVDDNAKTVTMTLPKLTFEEPDIDSGSLDFFKDYSDLNMDDILRYCQEDALSEAEGADYIYQSAESNLKSSIEALLYPITSSKNYTIVWNA